MATRKKQRDVLYRIESLEEFHEKVSPDNKKLVCKCSTVYEVSRSLAS